MGNHCRQQCVVTFLIATVGVLTAKPQSWNRERSQSQLQLLQKNDTSNTGDSFQGVRNAEVVNTGLSKTDIRRLKRYLPRERDLRPRKLFRLLGKNFNANWMSADKPLLHERGLETIDSKFGEEENIVNMLKTSGDKTKDLNNETLAAFKSWLLQLTSCEVEFQWKDLGPLVWPRYVKEGSCETKQSCSFPTGMKCVPGDFRKVYILKWQCTNVKKITVNENKVCITEKRNKKSKRHKLKCKWKRARFRVLQRCVCTC